jgi:hypothetical protein
MYAPGVAEDRLDQECANRIAASLEHVLEAIGVVERDDVDQVSQHLRHTRPGRLEPAVRVLNGLDLPERGVEEAVEATFDHDVAILAAERARKAKRRHHRLGPGVREPHQVRSGHHLLDALGDNDFAYGGECGGAAVFHAFPGGGIDSVVAVSEDRRAVAEPIVDVLVVVEVPDARALRALDVDRLFRSPGSVVRGDPKWQSPLGTLVVFVGFLE